MSKMKNGNKNIKNEKNSTKPENSMKKATTLSICTLLLGMTLFTTEKALGAEMTINPDSSAALTAELLAFNAISKGNEISLEWKTASEVDSEYFTVERSEDGVTFEQVISLAGKRTDGSTSSYKALDKEPFGNMSYYRIKQTDYNGQSSYSSIIPVELNTSDNSVSFTSGLSNDRLDLLFLSENNEKMKILIYDDSSSVVKSQNYHPQQGLNTFRIDLSELNPGDYVVVTVGKDGKSKMEFTKQ